MSIKFISEIGSNHNQSFTRTLQLISTAKSIGCWGVKFQLFSAETLYSKECVNERRKTKNREFPIEWLPEIYTFTKKSNIALGYSIFHKSFIDKVINYCDFLKISSWDVLRLDLIEKCWDTGYPLYISLGGINKDEFLNLLYKLSPKKISNLFFLHCIPKYPAKIEECNLEIINSIKNIIYQYHIKDKLYYLSCNLNNQMGWSDHTTEPGVIYQAISQGAHVIEFHLDLDNGQGNESIYKHVWFPSQIQEVIKNVKIGKKAQGSSELHNNEILFQQERMWRASPNDGMRPLEYIREQL